MTLIYNNKVKEVFGVISENKLVITCHKGLKDGEEHRAIGRHFTFLVNQFGLDSHKGIGCKSTKIT